MFFLTVNIFEFHFFNRLTPQLNYCLLYPPLIRNCEGKFDKRNQHQRSWHQKKMHHNHVNVCGKTMAFSVFSAVSIESSSLPIAAAWRLSLTSLLGNRAVMGKSLWLAFVEILVFVRLSFCSDIEWIIQIRQPFYHLLCPLLSPRWIVALNKAEKIVSER